MEHVSLAQLAQHHLEQARQADNGKSVTTLHGSAALRQIMLAFTSGNGLAEHPNPGEATLQILHGRAELATASQTWEGGVGDYLVIPYEPHNLTAVDDCVVMLTVAKKRE